MGAGLGFGSDQKEDQVHGSSVERVETDAGFGKPERCDQVLDAVGFTVRNGDPLSDACRAELLPVHQNLHYFL